MVSAPVFFLSPLSGCSYEFQIKNLNQGQTTSQRIYTYMNPQKYQFSSLRVTWFIMRRPSYPDPLLFSNFKCDNSPHIKCCLFGSSQHWVLYFLWSEIGVLSRLQYEALFLKFPQKVNPKGTSFTCVATVQLQSGEFDLLFQKNDSFNLAHSM